ncbi:unnamed protein product [Chondrus crispus]|uniref:Uncharacterized protein n=1 Tax=Chondrus crispus TaxID=2769 RepID=R7QP99_CHOCR|nr:unnamed protein product [Chondrus crispus]CDF39215.1 unnamed protein product [Chondrus crispus]|eukprot:XP_005719126.1 unnamed protein product [Chondrus crispus]
MSLWIPRENDDELLRSISTGGPPDNVNLTFSDQKLSPSSQFVSLPSILDQNGKSGYAWYVAILRLQTCRLFLQCPDYLYVLCRKGPRERQQRSRRERLRESSIGLPIIVATTP